MPHSRLCSAARGIGDILRVTPLVRVCRQLGYDVDVLLAPDYPDACALLDGAPDIRRVFLLPGPWRESGSAADSTGSTASRTTSRRSLSGA